MFTVAIFLAVALVAGASPAVVARADRGSYTSTDLTVADALFDGQCFYPKADDDFKLERYLGRWYQVASARVPFNPNCSCVYAEYSTNEDGTVDFFNQCQAGDQPLEARGTASPVNPIYGEKGVFRVELDDGGRTPACPGPNYIVQEYEHEWAIVLTANFSAFYLLSRQQIVPDVQLDAWLKRAEELGTNLTTVTKTDQTGCLFT